MFAWKSMDASSSLVKLKLDMVYRGLSETMASQVFTEITHPAQPATEVRKPKEVEEKPKPKKKVVKVAVPNSSTTK